MRKTVLALLLALVLVAASCLCAPTAALAAEKTVVIYHTNDSHGRMVGGDGVIGIDRIAGIKAGTPNALLLDAGDTLHGLPFVTINKGADAVALMNIAGYDAFTPGNHDFNYGTARLLELAAMADFDVLSCNVTKDGKQLLSPTAIKEVDGITVGLFGVSTPDTAYKTSPLNVKGVVFEDVAEQARHAVEILRSQRADVIVAIAHLGNDESSLVTSAELAEQVEGIDVIIDGHSHSRYDEGLTVNGVLIASANEYEAFLGRVTLTFDGNGNLTSKSAALISAEDAQAFSRNVAVRVKMKEIQRAQGALMNNVVAQMASTLTSAREDVRAKEMPLGNLVADALRAGTGADIAVVNGGGLRADLNEGSITRGDIIAVLPFGNYGVTKRVTPAILKAFLENGVGSAPALAGKFPQISGFSFTYNPALAEGSRVLSITMNGEALNMNDNSTSIVLATNDYMAVGGDGYAMLTALKTENEFGALDEMLLEYMQDETAMQGYAQADGRITVSDAAPAALSAPQPGTTPVAVRGGISAVLSQGRALNIRTGPGMQYAVTSVLRAGEQVAILETKNGWAHVSFGGGNGWVYNGYLRLRLTDVL